MKHANSRTKKRERHSILPVSNTVKGSSSSVAVEEDHSSKLSFDSDSDFGIAAAAVAVEQNEKHVKVNW